MYNYLIVFNTKKNTIINLLPPKQETLFEIGKKLCNLYLESEGWPEYSENFNNQEIEIFVNKYISNKSHISMRDFVRTLVASMDISYPAKNIRLSKVIQ